MSISNIQNQDDSLYLLGAQRRLYSTAKVFLGFQFFFVVFVPAVFSAASIFLKSETILSLLHLTSSPDISIISRPYAVLITLLDVLLFAGLVSSYQKTAALVQEEFDTKVLNLTWNTEICGKRPDAKQIVDYAQAYAKGDSEFTKVKNWYSPLIDTIPLKFGRFLCFYCNLSWDKSLRQRFNNILLILIIVLSVFITGVGLYFDVSLRDFFVKSLVPIFPIIVFFLRRYTKGLVEIQRMDTIQVEVLAAWRSFQETNSVPESIDDLARKIQNQIFQFRMNNPLIFDFFYSLNLQKDQSSSDQTIEGMIKAFKSKDKKDG
jgi:hypothetical protein